MTEPCTLTLDDAEATDALGRRLGGVLPARLVVHLRGELGAGKTALVRALVQSLGHEGPVRSPTYTLIEPYELPGRRLYHLDLYRLADPEELEYLGLREALGEDEGVFFIEWPERGEGWLPAPDLLIALAYRGAGRSATFTAGSEAGAAVLRALQRG